MPTTTDGDGAVISTSENMITVQFSRKIGRENYGNEEFGLFAQLPIPVGTDDGEIEAQVKGLSAFLKTLAYDQLGLESVVNEKGITRDVPAAPVAAPSKSKASAPAARAGGKPDVTAMWQAWCDSPGDWWDNREGKRNPKAPDFKGKKGTTFADEGLWIDKAPAFAKLVLEGAAAA